VLERHVESIALVLISFCRAMAGTMTAVSSSLDMRMSITHSPSAIAEGTPCARALSVFVSIYQPAAWTLALRNYVLNFSAAKSSYPQP
jgi:hypothetical protein